MTRDLWRRRSVACLLFLASLALRAQAQQTDLEESASENAVAIEEKSRQSHKPDTSLSRYRTAFDVLMERAIGTTERRVRYDWRRSPIQLGVHWGVPADLNNYNSQRAGAQLRLPRGDVLLTLDLSYVWVRDSYSSRLLALTPYRQPGRPNHWELDLGLSYPLAEGVMTAVHGFVPTTELVFNLLGQFRYFVYPKGFAGLGWGDGLVAAVAPSLSNQERNNLEATRLSGMELDPARYGLLTGLGTDLYFQSGVFLSVETLVGLPLLSVATDTKMLFSLELDLSVGFSL